MIRVGNGRTVSRWEAGEREIPGPVEFIVELLVNGVLRVDFGEGD